MMTMKNREKTVWEVAQEGERTWWFDGVHSSARMYEEQQKQITYAKKMGLILLPDGTYDMEDKSVLDIGGGPVSLLLKCKNLSMAKISDPMEIPGWVKSRYADHGVDYVPIKGEDEMSGGWDEVWLYNVLLHTENPEKVIENAKNAGKVIRIFEWVNTVTNDMHPHTLTKEQLDEWLGCEGTVGHVPNGDSEFYSAVVSTGLPTIVELGLNLGEEITQRNNELSISEVLTPIAAEGGGEGTKTHRHKRFHLLCLPHVAANKREGLACAFSQKVIKMGQMLKSLGHTVFCYGVEGSEVECDEFIQVSTQEILKKCYGDYDMKAVTYKHAQGDLAYETFNHFATVGIKERMQPDDFLLIPFSPERYDKIINALETEFVDKTDKLHLVVEMGVGYRGTRCKYKVFESISQKHYNYGLANGYNNGATFNGNRYDATIPNYFDPTDFEYSETKKDYFLYLGRVTSRKGVSDAIMTVEAMGRVYPSPVKLIIAGQKGDGNVDLNSPNVEYVGFADVEKRKELLRDANCLFLPTWYIEPFGGTIIEAAFSGTPVITSNHGAFEELVIHGKIGYRCNTLDQYVFAAKNIGNIKPIDCYNYAMKNFALDRVKWMYEEYFNMLLDVKENVNGQGWSRLHPERDNLDWLNKEY